MWFVYIIKTTNNKLYTGITTDVERRFREHLNDPKKGAKFFRGNPAKDIVHTEEFENRILASKREYQIKKLTRKQKDELIKSSQSKNSKL